jgi:hypothetical protein
MRYQSPDAKYQDSPGELIFIGLLFSRWGKKCGVSARFLKQIPSLPMEIIHNLWIVCVLGLG